ncbi:MAG TPA: glycosyltransferase [Limosilactobacillus oris]|uniref:glycosyltransferase n=1 Tax=Limosilactobacillus oris TaxID=1632 RepID=UPI001D284701|nr:glycosyltransferase [Limosilactobacillus oris]HJF47532.1 glycosyltransferase [Limosilactobacillus oris]
MNLHYAAIVVTYNRKKKLVKALNSLLNQTVSPKHIILIDNCSTDGTEELLKQEGLLSNKIIAYHKMQKNYGGSGGFYYGVKEAMKYDDIDFVSFSDDDAYFKNDFFEKVSMAQSQYKDCSAFCGTVKYANGDIQLDHRRKITNHNWLKEQQFEVVDYSSNFYVDTFSFVGAVIKMDVLREIGLPHKDYFIYYDDTEYSLRVREKGKVINISSAEIIHDILKKKVQTGKLISWKNYYELRNSILMKKQHSTWKLLNLYFYYRELHMYWYILTTNTFKGEKKRALFAYSHGFHDAMKGITGKVEPFSPGNF